MERTSEYKKCCGCGEKKKISLFNPRGDGQEGPRHLCKKCGSKSNQKRRVEREVRHEAGIGITAVEEKKCASCGKVWPAERFYPNIGSNDGLRSDCKECTHARHIKQTYGLEKYKYEEMLEEQGGVCAMCKTNEPRCVDHDHTTGLVRGLVCYRCNMVVGFYENTPNMFSLIKAYLGAYKGDE